EAMLQVARRAARIVAQALASMTQHHRLQRRQPLPRPAERRDIYRERLSRGERDRRMVLAGWGVEQCGEPDGAFRTDEYDLDAPGGVRPAAQGNHPAVDEQARVGA